jgi:dehydrogenase/reductase SDR family protein 12
MVGHAWRSLLFGIDGWRHYMKAGYERAAKSFDNSHLARDLTGRHVMVTGANSGIGYETARQLALQGATVCMVCRDRQRGTDARDAIRAELRAMSVGTQPESNVLEKNTKSAADDDDSHSARVSLRVCDVSSQRAVRDLVTAYVDSGDPLHVLVNNAGCMVHDFRETDEGLEVNFATNAVGPFTLTEGLLPILRRSGVAANEPSRVICVSSAGMLTEKLELDDPEMRKVPKFDGTRQYAKNKRFQVAMCEAWTKREQASARRDDKEKEVAVAFFSHHPGWSDTAAVRAALPGFYDTLKGRLRSPLEGADTVIWLAAVDQTNANATKTKQKTKALESGGFYFDRRTVAKHVAPLTFFATTRYSNDDVEKMERLLVAARDAALGRKSGSA